MSGSANAAPAHAVVLARAGRPGASQPELPDQPKLQGEPPEPLSLACRVRLKAPEHGSSATLRYSRDPEEPKCIVIVRVVASVLLLVDSLSVISITKAWAEVPLQVPWGGANMTVRHSSIQRNL
ncbi:MAG: hypothetical protein OXD50_04555 [Chloroflexi bacterium]|nr:hypothetical protein [Chloroflexota bacterium]